MAKKSKNLRHFEEEGEDLGYDHIWIIVDKDNNVKAACWSETYRDLHLRANPDHVAIRYEKLDSSSKVDVTANGSPPKEVDSK